MGRPPLPLGTMGEIRCYPQGRNYRAVANYRDFDGVTRRVERTGRTKAAARSRLTETCRDRGRTDAHADITPDTMVKAVAELWLRELKLAVEAGDRSPGTAQNYRDRLDNQVIPAPKKTATALTLEEVWDLRAKLAADPQAVAWDLPDFADMMMATGLRIGETAAITWASLDLDAGLVEVRGTVIRITGKGLIIKPKPKSKDGWRTIELPAWTVTLLRKRLANHEPNHWDVVFTSPTGRLRDPSNTQGDLRTVFDRAGYPHHLRKTVASFLDDAHVSARKISDQLGHARVSMMQDHYLGRRLTDRETADILEGIVPESHTRPHEK